jgi:hypothetical protein
MKKNHIVTANIMSAPVIRMASALFVGRTTLLDTGKKIKTKPSAPRVTDHGLALLPAVGTPFDSLSMINVQLLRRVSL